MANDELDEFDIVWPIPEGGIRYGDAVETVYAIKDAELYISFLDENADYTGASVVLRSDYSDHTFKIVKLIDTLMEALDGPYCQTDYVNDILIFDDDFTESWTEDVAAKHHKEQRLLIRLIRAYKEWEATDATYSASELKNHPLPKNLTQT